MPCLSFLKSYLSREERDILALAADPELNQTALDACLGLADLP